MANTRKQAAAAKNKPAGKRLPSARVSAPPAHFIVEINALRVAQGRQAGCEAPGQGSGASRPRPRCEFGCKRRTSRTSPHSGAHYAHFLLTKMRAQEDDDDAEANVSSPFALREEFLKFHLGGFWCYAVPEANIARRAVLLTNSAPSAQKC
jgi:hypothetical protein